MPSTSTSLGSTKKRGHEISESSETTLRADELPQECSRDNIVVLDMPEPGDHLAPIQRPRFRHGSYHSFDHETQQATLRHASRSHLHYPNFMKPPDDPHVNRKLPWRERLRHTTWAYFTLTMATGGLANVLHSIPQPYHPAWLGTVGLCFFFLNIALYLIIWAMLLTRFICFPHTFWASIIHPTESLFVPAFSVSLGTILITIVQYGASDSRPWLIHTVLVFFWCDVALAFILSIMTYMILWSSLTFTIAQMTPIWIFPAYPLLIIGPHAANLAPKLSEPKFAIEVIVGGFTVQGIGFLVSLTIYSAFVYRLMTQKLPADPSRPAMFVSVGPMAFSSSGIIGMAASLPQAIGQTDQDVFQGVPSPLAAQILTLVGNWMGLWLWGGACWFFFVSVIANVAPLWTYYTRKDPKHKITFAMTWYSYIFPQTALTTATLRVADAFDINALTVLGCVMAGLLVALWVFVVSMMIRAIIRKQILWPDKGEDKDEGGYFRDRERDGKPGEKQNVDKEAGDELQTDHTTIGR